MSHASSSIAARSRVVAHVALLAVGLLLAACGDAPTQASVYPSLALIYGQVHAPSGAVRAGLEIEALGWLPGACRTGQPQATRSERIVVTDGAGRFTTVLNTPRDATLCVTVRALGPAGAVLGESRVDAVPFRVIVPTTPPQVRDSVRVDLEVP